MNTILPMQTKYCCRERKTIGFGFNERCLEREGENERVSERERVRVSESERRRERERGRGLNKQSAEV